MFYDHKKIESDWQNYWQKNQTFKTSDAETSDLPKYYVLDMFPYPSGAGLHVGHPLGYIASDIYARYKRHQGFNVLHPIGYDSFGLPAEQYAIQTGQHPSITTEENITRYEEQLRKIGFSFDWSREVRTSNSDYYKWTQWIFIEFFHSWYNKITDKAEKIETLIAHLEKFGTENLNASETENLQISSEDWSIASEKEKQEILLNYRLAYRAETTVNWCPGLGTVLANDEVKDGKSERGGFPVFQKKMMQWSMRISAYSERLLEGLDQIDWPQPLKDSQKFWIGKSVGALVEFPLSPKGGDISNTKLESVDESIKSKSGKFGYMTGGNNSALLIIKAQEHRENPTEAEAILWEHLISKKLGYKFRQQHLIENFIVDFVCLKKGLIIEVDGGYHNDPEQQNLDAERTKALNEKGFEVVRFKNEEIIADIENVLFKIKEKLLSKSDITAYNTESQPLFTPLGERGISVFTTRPDTIFGATFMVLAPENPLINSLTTDEQKSEVENYILETSKKTERDRMTDVKTVSGAFTGSFAINPFTEKEIPIYISDYVLMGYGTGAVMAVPAHDERDHRFAKKFGIEILQVVEAEVDIQEESFDSKDSVCINSGFLDGLKYEEAKEKIISEIEYRGIGKGNINYRQRDAIFSRQRYWGEPVPVYYKNEVPYTLPLSALPLELPEVEKYLPTEEGNPPLGNAKEFAWDEENQKIVATNLVNNETIFPLELSTMPGWAGSSWYFLRYMDPHNETGFVSKEKADYWGQVDLYIGGSEHATGHLLYARFWNKFLKDRGFIERDEPFKKLINQGMILGMSAYVDVISLNFIDKVDGANVVSYKFETIISKNISEFYKTNYKKIHDIFMKDRQTSDILLKSFTVEELKCFNYFDKTLKEIGNKFNFSSPAYNLPFTIRSVPIDINEINQISNEIESTHFQKIMDFTKTYNVIFEPNLSFKVHREVEKMSKSKYNVVNPDEICEEYGADCLRLYEMFLGPLEQSKPWNTQGLSGVYGFLKKFYNLYFKEDEVSISDEEPTKEEWKVLHTLIKKFETDIQNFSFNTSVSSFMIAINDLQKLKCNKRAILEPLAIVISPYAPHICEELWSVLGHETSIEFEKFPVLEEKYLVEDEIEYPISINGKMKFKMLLSAELSKEEVEKCALEDERVQNILGGSTPKKIIVVPKKIVNIVM